MLSKSSFVRFGNCAHVLLRRNIGAVPSAEMIAVKDEKLLSDRHFCFEY